MRITGTLLISIFLLPCSLAAFDIDNLTICGTGDSQALLRAVGHQFESVHTQTSIIVPISIGSGGGIRSVVAGKCELGRIARTLKKKEQVFKLNYILFAKAPVVFVVHPSVTWIDSLTDEQVVGIYSGTISNWQQLGGPDTQIFVANREKGDSSRSVIEKTVSGFNNIKRFAGQILYSTPKTETALCNTSHTIGYLPLSVVKHTNLHILKLNGISPIAENIRNGTYPVIVPFGLVWKDELSDLGKSFIEFLFSPKGQHIISDFGAVPVKESTST